MINIGMAGTEEMYWAVTEFGACAGIEVTASHNPINYNGMKKLSQKSQPLDDLTDFQAIKVLAESQAWTEASEIGSEFDHAQEARQAYVDRVIGFMEVGALKPLKIVVNSGNGAGPTFDAIADQLLTLGAPLEFMRVHHTPDATFPNGIPNPLLPENHAVTADVVKSESADFAVAFDGDFDRCFFFDENGQFVPGEYVVGLLASIFLEKEAGSKIVHDPRVIWNSRTSLRKKAVLPSNPKQATPSLSKPCAPMKQSTGEMSAHHYFRDFAYCDSGMIPWVLVRTCLSLRTFTLGDWVKDRFAAFPGVRVKQILKWTTLMKLLRTYCQPTAGVPFNRRNRWPL